MNAFLAWAVNCCRNLFRPWQMPTRQQNRSRAHLRRGMHHMRKDEFFEAAVEYRAAVEANPDDIYAVINRGLAWLNLKDFEMALDDFESAIEIDPQCWFAWMSRGYTRESLGRMAEALDDFKAALSILGDSRPPERHHLLLGYAPCLIALNRIDEALSFADETVWNESDRPEGYDIRGRCRMELCLYEDAVADFTTAMRLGQRTENLLHCRGYTYAKIGRNAEAIADFEEILRTNPSNLAMHCYFGFHLNKAGEWRRAAAHYEELLKRHPAEPLVMNNFAWMLATCPQPEFRDGPRAVQLATNACEYSDWQVAHYIGTLAAAHAEIGDFARAVEFATRAIPLFQGAKKSDCERMIEGFQRGEPHRDQPGNAL